MGRFQPAADSRARRGPTCTGSALRLSVQVTDSESDSEPQPEAGRRASESDSESAGRGQLRLRVTSPTLAAEALDPVATVTTQAAQPCGHRGQRLNIITG